VVAVVLTDAAVASAAGRDCDVDRERGLQAKASAPAITNATTKRTFMDAGVGEERRDALTNRAWANLSTRGRTVNMIATAKNMTTLRLMG
jgi:hypothetical protein